jgi:hypothetical protein
VHQIDPLRRRTRERMAAPKAKGRRGEEWVSLHCCSSKGRRPPPCGG